MMRKDKIKGLVLEAHDCIVQQRQQISELSSKITRLQLLLSVAVIALEANGGQDRETAEMLRDYQKSGSQPRTGPVLVVDNSEAS